MEIGSSTKTSSPQTTASSRADQVAASAAAPTELAPEAAVQPSEAARFEPREGLERRAALDEVMRSAMERNLTIDPKTQAVVIQSVDPDTGKVIQQIPDETLLKLRIYARELRDARPPEESAPAKRNGRVA